MNFVTEKKLNLSFHDPDLEDAATEIVAAIQERIQALEDLLYLPQTTKSEGLIEQYLDLETWINGYLIYEMGRNTDAAYFSVFIFFDPSEQLFHLGPIWDFDTSFGNGDYDFEPEGFGLKRAKWVRPLFNYPAFVSALKEKWQSARESLKASIQQVLPEQAERIRISASLNNLCWPVSDRYGLTTASVQIRITSGSFFFAP